MREIIFTTNVVFTNHDSQSFATNRSQKQARFFVQQKHRLLLLQSIYV